MGKIISVTDEYGEEITDPYDIGNINPYRYRGYRYDVETGLYYLQSRYYNPEWGRFINADNIVTDSVIGTNLYAYCENNPIMYEDQDGHALGMATIGSVFGMIGSAISALVPVVIGVAAVAVGVAAVGTGIWIGNQILKATAKPSSPSSSSKNNKSPVSAASPSSNGKKPNDNDFDKKLNNKTSTPRGTQNPNTQTAIKNGQQKHSQWDYGPNTIKEFRLSPSARVDAINFRERTIYELKPNNAWSIIRGTKQLNRYTNIASELYGGAWKGELILY